MQPRGGGCFFRSDRRLERKRDHRLGCILAAARDGRGLAWLTGLTLERDAFCGGSVAPKKERKRKESRDERGKEGYVCTYVEYKV